jgi:hypothetical protein
MIVKFMPTWSLMTIDLITFIILGYGYGKSHQA